GVERDAEGLTKALASLESVGQVADGDPVIENATIAARFVTECALRRKETRGGHYRSDYPEADPQWQRRSAITLAGLHLRSALKTGELVAVIGGTTDRL